MIFSLHVQLRPTSSAHRELVSCPAPFMHSRERVWSKGSHFLVLEVRILRPNQGAEPWSHDISGM